MKKTLALIAALCLIISFAACKSDNASINSAELSSKQVAENKDDFDEIFVKVNAELNELQKLPETERIKRSDENLFQIVDEINKNYNIEDISNGFGEYVMDKYKCETVEYNGTIPEILNAKSNVRKYTKKYTAKY